MAQTYPKVIIVGSGIIGAVSAYALQSRGAQVLVLDAGGASATDASFGWINASYYQTREYFTLRVAAIDAYRRLQERLDIPVQWCGSLAWEFSGAALQEQFETLTAQGYPCRMIEAAEIRTMEPDLGAVPDRALHFPSEAAVDASALTRRLLAEAKVLGARIASGFRVSHLEQTGGRITGVRTAEGLFEADEVLIAAGTGTEHLLESAGFSLPMLQRPALVLRTRPASLRLSHVLATDFGEVRQMVDGSIMTPAAIGHQADASDTLDMHPDKAAQVALDRLVALFPRADIGLGAMHLAHRPVPQDGFPAVGRVAQGLYAATMHSGITLAALMGDLIAHEMLSGPSNETEGWLNRFRPQRFG